MTPMLVLLHPLLGRLLLCPRLALPLHLLRPEFPRFRRWLTNRFPRRKARDSAVRLRFPDRRQLFLWRRHGLPRRHRQSLRPASRLLRPMTRSRKRLQSTMETTTRTLRRRFPTRTRCAVNRLLPTMCPLRLRRHFRLECRRGLCLLRCLLALLLLLTQDDLLMRLAGLPLGLRLLLLR